MSSLTEQQAKAWCAVRHIDCDELRHTVPALAPPILASYRVPADSGRKVALARALSIALHPQQDEPETLLWVQQTGVWPSGENKRLFELVRAGLGETSSLKDYPAQLFSGPTASSDLECLLSVGLFFFWDLLVIAPRSSIALSVSHDECLDVISLFGGSGEDVRAVLSAHLDEIVE